MFLVIHYIKFTSNLNDNNINIKYKYILHDKYQV